MNMTVSNPPIEAGFSLPNVQVLHGCCLEQMAAMIAAGRTVQSVVTDPPYGLHFMGAKWDAPDNIAFRAETWRLAYDLLAPGGHMAVFGGSRTHHRMACAIEDAGFEIRDTLFWIYGCLSDDTEIVTPNGVMPYRSVKVGDPVLCYDPADRSYSWQAVQDVYEYEIDDTVFRIRGDHTDQIVSRNHRCLVERSGMETFVFAEEVARQREAGIPVLENLPALLEALSCDDERTSRAQHGMRAGMRGRADRGEEQRGKTRRDAQAQDKGGVRGLRDGILPEREACGAHGGADLLTAVQRETAWAGVGQACPQKPWGVDGSERSKLPGEDDGASQSSMEGRRHLSQSARQLCVSSLCEMPAGIPADGTDGWIRDGASLSGGAASGAHADTDGMCASHQSRSARQSAGEPDAVRHEQGSQVVRAWRGHYTDLATITPERYRGRIWCVRVPTGCFVAVRNGMAFPTGNSGFPKSLNVSAAIDRAAGAERQVIGEGKGRTGAAAQPNGGSTFSDDAYQWPGKFSVTAPATPEAQRWDGWGTSLKPAVEPIILARKPLSEKSVAANVCKHGVGAINIDATRVGTGDDRTSGGNPSRADFSAGSGMASTQRATGGRWPPNILTDGSPEVLAAFARFGESKARNGGTTNGHGPNDGWGMGAAVNPVYRDSGTAARFFPALGYDADELRFMYCAKASRRERGEGNTHSTVKPLALMRWLTRLITPPGGTVLDCFAGSGTTGIACMREGFNAVLIERESEYVQMIQKRLGMCAADIQPNLFS